jgi:acetoacetate decarboxylase
VTFVKSQSDIEKIRGFMPHFYDAESINVFWETTPEIVAKLLPPPLKPAAHPLVWAFVANYPRTNFGVPYLEAALLLAARFNGEDGFHCIAMPVTDDMAMIYGREMYGYPKKIAKIAFKHEGTSAAAWVERHSTRFFQISANLEGKTNTADAQALLAKYVVPPIKIFLFKYFSAPEDILRFDYNPRLIREEISTDVKQLDIGEARIVMPPAEHDPWAEVEVKRVLSGAYMKYDSIMQPGKVVADVDPVKFLPHAFMKIDAAIEPVPPTRAKKPRERPRKETVEKSEMVH